jgi:hypothetical protein
LIIVKGYQCSLPNRHWQTLESSKQSQDSRLLPKQYQNSICKVLRVPLTLKLQFRLTSDFSYRLRNPTVMDVSWLTFLIMSMSAIRSPMTIMLVFSSYPGYSLIYALFKQWIMGFLNCLINLVFSSNVALFEIRFTNFWISFCCLEKCYSNKI